MDPNAPQILITNMSVPAPDQICIMKLGDSPDCADHAHLQGGRRAPTFEGVLIQPYDEDRVQQLLQQMRVGELIVTPLDWP